MKTLTWKVKKNIPTSCPDNVPDKYTGEYSMITCLVYHFKTVIEDRTAKFELDKEVTDFVEKAPLSCYDFKLNGISVEDKREKPTESHIDISGTSATVMKGDSTLSN